MSKEIIYDSILKLLNDMNDIGKFYINMAESSKINYYFTYKKYKTNSNKKEAPHIENIKKNIKHIEYIILNRTLKRYLQKQKNGHNSNTYFNSKDVSL